MLGKKKAQPGASEEIARDLYHFWGESSGSIEELARIEEKIRAAKLSDDEILDGLLPRIPAGSQGVTGARCNRAIAMLKRVARSN